VTQLLTDFNEASGQHISIAYRNLLPVLFTSYRDGYVLSQLDQPAVHITKMSGFVEYGLIRCFMIASIPLGQVLPAVVAAAGGLLLRERHRPLARQHPAQPRPLQPAGHSPVHVPAESAAHRAGLRVLSPQSDLLPAEK